MIRFAFNNSECPVNFFYAQKSSQLMQKSNLHFSITKLNEFIIS